MREYKLRPHEIDEMTRPEILTMYNALGDKRSRMQSVWEDYMRAYAKATPQQKLKIAARTYGV